jgi:hypothetical protein
MRVDGERGQALGRGDVADVAAEGALVDREIVVEREQDGRDDTVRQIVVARHGVAPQLERLQSRDHAASSGRPQARPLMHNDTVVQGFKRGAVHAGREALGRADHRQHREYKVHQRKWLVGIKSDLMVRKSRAKRGGRLEPWTGARRCAHPRFYITSGQYSSLVLPCGFGIFGTRYRLSISLTSS